MSYSERSSITCFILNAVFRLNQTASWDLKEKIHNTHDKLSEGGKGPNFGFSRRRGPRSFSLRAILENHSDLPRSVPNLFYSSAIINMVLFAFSMLAAFFYLVIYLGSIIGATLLGSTFSGASREWIGLILVNVFYLAFLIRGLSDAYKVSLRGNYRNQYLKLLFLDLLTLNFLSVIGILIFSSNRALMLKDYQDDVINFAIPTNQKAIKKFSWAIMKAQLIVFLVTFILCLLFFLTGYLIKIKVFKDFCFFVLIFLLFFVYVWVLPNMAWVLIAQRMLIKLVQTTSTLYFLSAVHFLGILNSYYLAIFFNLLSFENSDQVYILENW